MKTTDKFFANLYFLRSPILDLQKSLPIIADFINIPFPTMKISFLPFYPLFDSY